MSGQPGRMQLLDVAAQGRDGIRIRRGDIHANNLAQEARILAAARSDPFERATEPETLAIPTEGRIPSKGSRRERALGAHGPVIPTEARWLLLTPGLVDRVDHKGTREAHHQDARSYYADKVNRPGVLLSPTKSKCLEWLSSR